MRNRKVYLGHLLAVVLCLPILPLTAAEPTPTTALQVRAPGTVRII